MKRAQVPSEPPAALLGAIRSALRPLVRLLIGRRIVLAAVVEMLKSLYVEVAERHFPVEGRALTDSRINLLTGVHRKDVRRLRGIKGVTEPMPREIALGTQLVARWLGDSRFSDSSGNPLALPMRPRNGEPSFDELSRLVSHGDVRPRVLLDELLRVGVVESSEGDQVQLRVAGFVPDAGLDEKAAYFGRNIRDHIATCVNNIEQLGPPMFERSVAYHGLSDQDIEKLRELGNTLATDALKKLNRQALAMQRRNADSAEARHRFNFGCYVLTAPERSDEEGGDDHVP